MQNTKETANAELLGIDKALHRAATNAKLQAERLGVPHVVRDSSNAKFLGKEQKNAKTK